MLTPIFITSLVFVSVAAVIMIIVVFYFLLKQKRNNVSKVRDYGTCDKSDLLPLTIKVTKPENDDIDENVCEHILHDERRCTMPCILPSCRHHSLLNSGSTESLLDDEKDSFSSSLLSTFFPQARRYSDNQLNDTRGGDHRKNSHRPDMFSIISLNLETSTTNSPELLSYDRMNMYGQGKLSFSLVYNVNISRLYVTINKAVYLNSSKLRNLAGFYVKVYLMNIESNTLLQMFKSAIVTANNNPMFEQTFSYTLSKSSMSNVHLRFVVKQVHNNVSKNEVIGEFSFSLKNEDLVLHPELFQELWRELKGYPKIMHNLGEVLISLRYSTDPSNSITVNVQRAKNLRLRQHDNSVFARCTMLSGNTALRTKRSVTVKTDISSPYLDHECLFRMQNHSIMEIGIAVHICSRSKIGFSHVLGKVMLGSVIYTDDETITSHWLDMINYPGRSITKWHKIF